MENGEKSWADLVEEEEEANPQFFVKEATPQKPSDGWSVVIKRKNREHKNIISVAKAFEIQRALKIDCLAKTLLSNGSKDIQLQGYVFKCVLKPQDQYFYEEIDGEIYLTMAVPNRWSDRILFAKSKS